jgi:D-alanine-D-alanine ligase
MRIGITYDLKSDTAAGAHLPDDHQEEFDSPVTIEAIAEVLRGMGHEVIPLGNGPAMVARLLADPPEFVFNFAEGVGTSRNREARVPAVCELLNIPHTGSDVLTLAATLDKDCARRLVASDGLPVPRGRVLTMDQHLDEVDLKDLPFPLIVKPAWEGSSKGIRGKCVAEDERELASAVEFLRSSYPQPVLIEEFIEGEELTVGMIGNKNPHILGILRVLPLKATARFVYSLEVKRDYLNQVRYECPARLAPADVQRLETTARAVFRVLGCRDVARVDFRMRAGVPYFLEVNPLPGLNPESSDLVILARAVGWSYERLIGAILQAALERTGVAGASSPRQAEQLV